jgi:glycosyltransferase involved in cell wall biosynthesis
MIKTLLFSTLYPSAARPLHGIFVETRLRELLKSGEIETKVVAPVPWFPFKGKIFGDYGLYATTPHFEQRNGVDVFYPRYFLPPKIGMNISPYTLAYSALPTIKKLLCEGFDFDLIDAHYYYPDGVAASLIAKTLEKPFVITARGTDVNLIPQFTHPRRLMLQTAEAAYASIGVSKALVDRLAELGAAREKLKIFRNGVDLGRFQPEEKTLARKKIGINASRILLSVGNLIELKGHHIAIDALSLLSPDIVLVIAGSGPERQSLENQANRLNLDNRVFFTGQIDNSELKWWYSAADALVLCSSREGWPNVLLEAMACGTPAIATDIGGVPEIITAPVAGRLMRQRSPQCLSATVTELFAEYPERIAVRNYAEEFTWDATTEQQLNLFREITHS